MTEKNEIIKKLLKKQSGQSFKYIFMRLSLKYLVVLDHFSLANVFTSSRPHISHKGALFSYYKYYSSAVLTVSDLWEKKPEVLPSSCRGFYVATYRQSSCCNSAPRRLHHLQARGVIASSFPFVFFYNRCFLFLNF